MVKDNWLLPNNFLLAIRHFTPKKKYILGLGPGCEPKTKINLGLDSEFNSIHFDLEINKRLKFLTPISFCV